MPICIYITAGLRVGFIKLPLKQAGHGPRGLTGCVCCEATVDFNCPFRFITHLCSLTVNILPKKGQEQGVMPHIVQQVRCYTKNLLAIPESIFTRFQLKKTQNHSTVIRFHSKLQQAARTQHQPSALCCRSLLPKERG